MSLTCQLNLIISVPFESQEELEQKLDAINVLGIDAVIETVTGEKIAAKYIDHEIAS